MGIDNYRLMVGYGGYTLRLKSKETPSKYFFMFKAFEKEATQSRTSCNTDFECMRENKNRTTTDVAVYEEEIELI